MTMFEVQENVPLPSVDTTPKNPSRKYPLNTMAVGGMFFVPGKSTRSLSSYIARASTGTERKFNVRHCWMRQVGERAPDVPYWVTCEQTDEDAVEGTGVWRTK